jgi:predicted PurR-regulated permease PerM
MKDQNTIAAAARPELWMRQIWLFLWRVALVIAGGYLIWRVRTIVEDVLIASIFAFALVGPVNRLCAGHTRFLRPRTKRLLATMFVFIMLGVLISIAVTIFISPFQQEVRSLKMNKAAVLAAAASAKTWYHSLPAEVRAYVEKQNPAAMIPSPGRWISQALLGTVAGISKIVDIILVPVLAFYFVLDGRELRNEFLAVLPKSRRREAIALLRESSLIMRTFIVAQIWLCVIAGVVVFCFLSAFGMPSPLILALLAGITRAIPIIGPVISGIPIVLLALLQPNGVVLALKVLTFFSIMHLVESKLIMPKFIGHRIHLHAALVIIVLLIGYEFFGLLGMFMAAPVAAFGRVLVSYYVIRPRRSTENAQKSDGAAQPSLLIKAQ